MKHHGLITSEEADKLYSYPTLSGASDTFLNGAGDFDHPHVEYGAKDVGQTGTYTLYPGRNGYTVHIETDKYGHVENVTRYPLGITSHILTDDCSSLMSGAEKTKLNAYPSAPADSALQFTELTMVDGSHVSLLAAVPSS